MLYHGAWLANEGLPCSVETSMAKLFVADVGMEIALTCQQVMGAYALSDAYAIERNVRDLLSACPLSVAPVTCRRTTWHRC
jgi:alkylation response protein AidB-like acyl-CoA dehydrogenase|tara:strand:+ start:204 stop:446 length:243 start_codon:yes stop_codon:yes gene_type:complete